VGGRVERVVCVATGNVLKDPDEVIRISGGVKEVPADYEELLRVI
jgi:threonine synthase